MQLARQVSLPGDRFQPNGFYCGIAVGDRIDDVWHGQAHHDGALKLGSVFGMWNASLTPVYGRLLLRHVLPNSIRHQVPEAQPVDDPARRAIQRPWKP